MANFSEALKARIESMSPDELAAAEARRLSREAGRSGCDAEALWEQTRDGAGAGVLKPVRVQVDCIGTSAPDVLKISQDTTFHESLVLTPNTYRLLAGGQAADAVTDLPDRFIVHPGGDARDRVSMDRSALAAIVEGERPADMSRARRLVAMEQGVPTTARLPFDKRVTLFIQRWEQNLIEDQLRDLVATTPSRGLFLMTRHDRVAVRVDREDKARCIEDVLTSPLAAAVIPPPPISAEGSVLVGSSLARSDHARLQHHRGQERFLLLDLTCLRDILVASDGSVRARTILLLKSLVARGEAIGRGGLKQVPDQVIPEQGILAVKPSEAA